MKGRYVLFEKSSINLLHNRVSGFGTGVLEDRLSGSGAKFRQYEKM